MRLVRQKTIEAIIISDAVYTGCGAVQHIAPQQIPVNKLMTRSNYDVLTRQTNDLQWLHVGGH